MKIINTSGSRKRAIARATLKEGKGVIRINHRELDTYDSEFMKTRIMEPLILAGDLSKKVNVNVNVHGGGQQSQTEAARLAIARGLVEISGSKQLKRSFLDYDRHLLIADVRRNESHKPNDSKPRAKRQWTKR